MRLPELDAREAARRAAARPAKRSRCSGRFAVEAARRSRLTPAALFELERRRLLVRPPWPRAALQGHAARRLLVWALRLRVTGLLG